MTTEKREFEVAGATLKDFSLGKINTNVTPEFQRIASEAALNEDSRVRIACKAMEMSGVKASPEMLTYYLHLLGFLSSTPSPSVEKRMEWAEKFPVPKIPQPRAPSHTDTRIGSTFEFTVDPSIIRLAQSCKQPMAGLRRQPEDFFPTWHAFLFYLKREKFPPDRDLLNLYLIKGRYKDSYNLPEDFFSESLYTIKCLEDVDAAKLEKLGTTATYGGKVFDNQRIIFP